MFGNPFYEFLGLVALFFCLENLFPIAREISIFRRERAGDFLYFFTNKLVLRLAFMAFSTGLLWLNFKENPLAPTQPRGPVAGWPWWLQLPLVLVVSDGISYAVHRLFHAVPFLWRFHTIHHSSEALDWLKTARTHPLEVCFIKVSQMLPFLFLGFSPGVLAAFYGFAVFHGNLSHANFRLRFGPLRWILVTPEYHHWHHATDGRSYNRNFAVQLVLFDFIFGTATPMDGTYPKSYGIAEKLPPGFFGQLAFPFRRKTADTPP